METEIKDHLDRDVKTVCAYCNKEFQERELMIEKEIHGRKWRFCSEHCYNEFMDALDFVDEEDPTDDDKPRDPDF